MNAAAQPRATLSVFEGVCMIISVVVGIGIFKIPALVAGNVSSEAMFVSVWVVGGLITMVGALCYAELGSSYPSEGGEYHFLRRAFGRSTGLFFAWARGTVIQTGAIAALAFVYGDYAQQLVPLGPYGPSLHAFSAVIAFTALNVLGTRPSKSVQIAMTVAVILGLAAMVAIGLTAPVAAEGVPPAQDNGSALGMAMVLVLLTFGGWNEAAYLSGEIREVRRKMARILAIGVVVIMAFYILINMAYLNALGLERLRGTEAPGADLVRITFGELGAMLLSLGVCIAALTSVNATIFTGGRAYFALGRDLPHLRFLGEWDQKGSTPRNALLVQGVISSGLVLFGAIARDGFQSMVDYTAPVFWFFMLLVSLSLFVLRGKHPGERPFSVPFYPVLPALFSATCLGLLYSSLAYTGLGALIGIVVLLAGVPVVMMERRFRLQPAE
ncbi:amino acid transporter [Rhodoligotrophos appendicifer]|uniref:APC family permease n=1 Tax=Rhodoligotrophos appendicifer TaxID=987056 RepID=UPI0011853790|nr:amino acid permease [Rhodoligotrophos appendicifer]